MLKIRFPKGARRPLLVLAVGLCLPVRAGIAADGAGPAPAAVDSVRTNLWLCESLMEKIADEAVGALPVGAAAVRLVSEGKLPGQELLGQILYSTISEAGYEVYADVPDTSRQAAVDYLCAYRLKEVTLDYPRVGRMLGLWRQWMDRDVKIAAEIEIVEVDTGRMLFDDLVTRGFSDRIEAGDFDEVNSEIYTFTSANTTESGWHRRIEEIVVLGTLTGMVAVYFANTGN